MSDLRWFTSEGETVLQRRIEPNLPHMPVRWVDIPPETIGSVTMRPATATGPGTPETCPVMGSPKGMGIMEGAELDNCPQCGELTPTLNEGYCEGCRAYNQERLDQHNAGNDEWESLTDGQRIARIKAAYDV